MEGRQYLPDLPSDPTGLMKWMKKKVASEKCVFKHEMITDTEFIQHEITEAPYKPIKDNVVLPTAPKAARSANVDTSRIPANGPFKLHIGNIPYDTTQEEINGVFRECNVSLLNFIHYGPDRLFPSMESVIECSTTQR